MTESSSPFQRIDQKSVVDAVREQMRTLIRDGSLKPGDQLPAEKELAQRLNVSRATLREALHTMIGEGLLEVRRGQGTFVRELSSSDAIQSQVVTLLLQPEDMAEVQDVRRILEPEIAARVALRADEKLFTQMEELLDELEAMVSRGESIFEMAWDFHRMLAHASGNGVLAKFIDILYEMIAESEGPLYEKYFDFQHEINEHRKLLAVIRGRSASEARAAMLAHLDTVDEGLDQALKAEG